MPKTFYRIFTDIFELQNFFYFANFILLIVFFPSKIMQEKKLGVTMLLS
jgi:hypothetical protein